MADWIAFFAGGKLKKISVTGGAAVTLCDTPNGRGGTWAEDGTIVLSPSNTSGVSLLRVSSAGGKPETLTTLDQGEVTQRWPQVLPGGKAVLCAGASGTTAWEGANVVVQPPPSGVHTVEGDSFRAEKPRPWSEGRDLGRLPRATVFRSFDRT